MDDKTPFPIARLGAKALRDDDRRAQPRRPCSLEVSCQPITAKGCDLWWLAEIRDFSADGVGMLSTRRFERGTFLAIQFLNLANADSKTRTAQVTHVAPCHGGWFIGCAFRTPLDKGELQDFAAMAVVR